MSNDNTLLDFKTVRIRRFDTNNIVVEKLVDLEPTYRDPKSGKTITRTELTRWDIFGYYGNVKQALRSIYANDLLMEEKSRTIEEYLEDNRKMMRTLNGDV